MKNYNVKYEIGQMVYVLMSKKSIQTQVQKIRIIEQQKGCAINETDENKKKDAVDGITIEYLVQVDYRANNLIMSQAGMAYFDWMNQNDIFSTKEELISQIK
jgi:hypothetical protein